MPMDMRPNEREASAPNDVKWLSAPPLRDTLMAPVNVLVGMAAVAVISVKSVSAYGMLPPMVTAMPPISVMMAGLAASVGLTRLSDVSPPEPIPPTLRPTMRCPAAHVVVSDSNSSANVFLVTGFDCFFVGSPRVRVW